MSFTFPRLDSLEREIERYITSINMKKKKSDRYHICQIIMNKQYDTTSLGERKEFFLEIDKNSWDGFFSF